MKGLPGTGVEDDTGTRVTLERTERTETAVENVMNTIASGGHSMALFEYAATATGSQAPPLSVVVTL